MKIQNVSLTTNFTSKIDKTSTNNDAPIVQIGKSEELLQTNPAMVNLVKLPEHLHFIQKSNDMLDKAVQIREKAAKHVQEAQKEYQQALNKSALFYAGKKDYEFEVKDNANNIRRIFVKNLAPERIDVISKTTGKTDSYYYDNKKISRLEKGKTFIRNGQSKVVLADAVYSFKDEHLQKHQIGYFADGDKSGAVSEYIFQGINEKLKTVQVGTYCMNGAKRAKEVFEFSKKQNLVKVTLGVTTNLDDKSSEVFIFNDKKLTEVREFDENGDILSRKVVHKGILVDAELKQ